MQVEFATVTAKTQTPKTTARRIYVACLAAYNDGILHGAWISVEDFDQIWDEVNAMLAKSPVAGAEEWAIHDHEGLGDQISESTDFETIVQIADFFEEVGNDDLAGAIYGNFGDIDSAKHAHEESYAGQFDDLGAFAAEINADMGREIPDWLQFYVDWGAMGRDMELNGDVWTFEEGYKRVHVFWNH